MAVRSHFKPPGARKGKHQTDKQHLGLYTMLCKHQPDSLDVLMFYHHCISTSSLVFADLKGAVEEVLPTLKQQGVQVFILSDDCDVEGIESLSDKIQQASAEPLPPQLRANVSIKSPALYIYTSGTTGNLTGFCF